jgi:roadblock/LC7 domain-containing protein
VVTREDLVEQSVTDFVRAGLEGSDLSSKLTVREAFPDEKERATELTQTQVAIGFNFDDGGRLIELGSDLTERVYTITFWTFGTTKTMGRSTANFIRQLIEAAGLIPLKDVATAGQPVIDQLTLPERQAATVTRQIAPNPRPWDLFVWTTVVKVIDQYSPSSFG